VLESITDDDLAPGALTEHELFTLVYRSLAPAVIGYMSARGVDDPEALAQDVFVAVLPRLGAITGGAAGLKTLVFSVAHARVVDHYRRTERRPRIVDYDPLLDLRETASAEHDALLAAGQTDAEILIGRLKGDQKEVLTLRIVAELSIEEVASVLGKTPGAVKQLQRRALLALREHVVEEEWVRSA
jgi:RNA polymerase sigma-70 factor (ECF subfamily)